MSFNNNIKNTLLCSKIKQQRKFARNLFIRFLMKNNILQNFDSYQNPCISCRVEDDLKMALSLILLNICSFSKHEDEKELRISPLLTIFITYLTKTSFYGKQSNRQIWMPENLFIPLMLSHKSISTSVDVVSEEELILLQDHNDTSAYIKKALPWNQSGERILPCLARPVPF